MRAVTQVNPIASLWELRKAGVVKLSPKSKPDTCGEETGISSRRTLRGKEGTARIESAVAELGRPCLFRKRYLLTIRRRKEAEKTGRESD